MQDTNQALTEYRSLKALRLCMTGIMSKRVIGRRADEVWKQMPWNKFQNQLFRLQRSIFKVQKNGQKAKVKRLQRLTLQSRAGWWS